MAVANVCLAGAGPPMSTTLCASMNAPPCSGAPVPRPRWLTELEARQVTMQREAGHHLVRHGTRRTLGLFGPQTDQEGFGTEVGGRVLRPTSGCLAAMPCQPSRRAQGADDLLAHARAPQCIIAIPPTREPVVTLRWPAATAVGVVGVLAAATSSWLPGLPDARAR